MAERILPGQVSMPVSDLVRAVPRPVQPISTISGNPVQTSIFQPNETTATIIQTSQSQLDYVPASGAVPLAQPAVETPVQQPAQQTIFGLEPNTFWLIVLLAAALLIAVML